MLTFLPAIIAAVTASPSATDTHAPKASAQAELATVLSGADAIDWVAANGPTITFGIERGDSALRVVVHTRAHGEVVSFAVVPARTQPSELGGLSWLGDELRDGGAIELLVSDADGAVTIGTSDGRKYMAIPGRGSGGHDGNAAPRARWAAEWNDDAHS